MSKALHDTLRKCVADGLATCKAHGGLEIFNYSAVTVFKKLWTPELLMARGLIIDAETSEIVARPFPKFFNMGERAELAEDALPWGEPHDVYEKMDGSLGIIYWHRGRWNVATRGAFRSAQAIRGQELLGDREFSASAYTFLVEIIYPENRVVVDYHGRSELVLLGAIHTASGREMSRMGIERSGLVAKMRVVSNYGEPYEGSLPELRGCPVLGHPLVAPQNIEGYVIHWPLTGLRVKIKAPAYVAAHRMLGAATPKRVLETIIDGTADDVAAQCPPHVREEFEAVQHDLLARAEEMLAGAKAAHVKVLGLLDSTPCVDERVANLKETRKAFALAVAQCPPSVQRPLVFAILDGRDPFPIALKILQRELAKGLALGIALHEGGQA